MIRSTGESETVFPFSTVSATTPDQVGGKASSLIDVTRAGFNVPPGVVLSVNFFSSWLEEVESSEVWSAFLSSPEEELRQYCDVVKARCSTLQLTQTQRDVLGDALRRLPTDGLFAVRSSSPEEDLEGSSFAGEYETSLGVTFDGLEKAILHSFASVFDERVVRYKLQRGMRIDQPRIAVIVQQQIASDVSGVAFSLNPLNNCYDEAVVNANFGLGETIVGGSVNPDTYVVEKTRGEIIDKRVASKSHAVWLEADGGTRAVENKHPEAPSLSDAQVLAVAELAALAEAHHGCPIDIEWAIQGEDLYLLQSRPVTAYLPLPEDIITRPGEEKCLYLDLIVLSQGFSDNLSVLGGQYWGKMLEAIKGETMIDRGMDGTLLNTCGRQYIHCSNLTKAFGSLMTKSLETYDTPTRKIFGTIDLKKDYLPAKKPDALKGMVWAILGRMVNMLRHSIRGLRPKEAREAYERAADSGIAECRRLSAEGRPLDELAEQFLGRFNGMINDIVGVLLPAMLARWRLGRLFRNDEAKDLLVALEMDLYGNPTSEMGHLLYEMASFNEIQETADGGEFARNIESGGYSSELMDAYRTYIDKFGCRGIKEIDIATPRGYEDLSGFFNQLRAIDVSNNAIKNVRQRRAKAHDELLDIATKKGKRKKFERLAKQHRMAGFREAPKYFFIVTVDLMRRRALELGDRFVQEGRLEDPHQIFDLKIEQIARAERDPDVELIPLVLKNLEPRRRLEHVKSWPRVIDSRGRIFRAPSDDTADGLVGDPIAPGVVRGPAKVLHEPYEKPLNKGEILVTRASDPGWTPIFINAAGVVLEVGGALQHGGVIAREYGLPCVSGLEGITEKVQDGQMIEVDGSNGVVRLIAPNPEQGT